MKLEIERNIASPQEEEEEEFEPVMNGMAMDSVGFENIEIREEQRRRVDPRCDEENLGDLEGKPMNWTFKGLSVSKSAHLRDFWNWAKLRGLAENIWLCFSQMKLAVGIFW